MEKEFNLSEKTEHGMIQLFDVVRYNKHQCDWIRVEDLKEFIKRVKNYCQNYITDDTTAIQCMIDKLAGDKLI